jgi:hypothetical protein
MRDTNDRMIIGVGGLPRDERHMRPAPSTTFAYLGVNQRVSAAAHRVHGRLERVHHLMEPLVRVAHGGASGGSSLDCDGRRFFTLAH